MRSKTIILVFSLLLIVIAGCGNTSSTISNNDETLNITTTIYPIQYMIERIGGDTVVSDTVYPPGTDAHSYEPTAKEMTKIAEGDAFIYLGANLEVFAETAANALESENIKLVELGTNEQLFAPLTDHQQDTKHNGEEEHDDHDHVEEHDGHTHGDHDPHIWLDPVRAIELATLIKQELLELLPEEEKLIEENFEGLVTDLQQLDDQFKQILADKSQKKILVAHGAYGYWEQRYGIEQIAVNGITANSEPSQQDLIRIIEQAEQYNLNHMIFEQNISETVATYIQDEIGASTLTIHNLSVLTEEDIKNNENYLSLMKRNIKALDLATN